METNLIESLIKKWNPHFEDVKLGMWVGSTHRTFYLDKMSSLMNIRHILILTGVRRSGKSTIMRQMVGRLIKSGVKPTNILYLYLEDVMVQKHLAEGATLLEEFYTRYLEKYNPQGKIYVFLDELQGIPDFNRWLHTRYEFDRDTKFIVSGSSRSILEGKTATLLTGRNILIDVYPFTFAEYLHLHRIKIKSDSDPRQILDYHHSQQSQILHHLGNYLFEGGFPEIVLADNAFSKSEIASGYYQDIISRDVLGPHEVRNSQEVEVLGIQILSDFTKTHSYRNLGRTQDLSVGTIKTYLDYFSQSYLFSESTYFSYKTKESQDIRRPRKIYVVDNGLRNFIVPQLRPDLGQCAENVVYQELKKRKVAIYYWQGKKEVDFVTLNPNLELYNVSYTDQPPDRETEGMLEAMTEFKQKQAVILTKNYSASIDIDGHKIEYIPLWAWLLTDQDQTPTPSP